MNVGRTVRSAVLVTAVAVAFIPYVYAQGGQSGISALMDEITVTARKVEENIQDTPIAVSAFSGESLQARGIERIDNLDSITPNMEFRNVNVNGAGGSNASVYIRGVGQTDFVPSADPGVGIYVDGVYFARSIGSVLDLIDIERVEVLRGPQGTLFGRNTTGGAVAIHTKKPHEEFEGKIRAKTGTDDRIDVIGKVNGALTDNLFASVTFATLNQDGYVVNPDNGLDTGDTDRLAFRGAIRRLVNADLEINVSGDWSQAREHGQAIVSSSDASDALVLAPGSGPFFHNVIQGSGPAAGPILNPGGDPQFLRFRNNCDATPVNIAGSANNPDCANASNVGLGTNNGTNHSSISDSDIWGVAATIDWQITDNLKIKSITSYRDLFAEFSYDGDTSPFLLSWVRDYYEQNQFTQELQIHGTNFDDRLTWIIGGFYFEEDGLNYNPVDFALLDIESGGFFDHQSLAGFAQFTFDVTDKLHLTAGIRYTDDRKDFIVRDFTYTGADHIAASGQVIGLQTAQVFVAPPFVTLTLVNPDTYTLKADDWSPMVNIAYDWNDDLMAYFTFSEGFKSGGVQQRIAGPVGFAPTYDPEFVESYEIGFKYNSPNGSFTANAAAFYADYTDIQLETIDPNGGIAPQLENSGVGEIKGFELEMRWTPIDTWFTEVALGHLDANITEADPNAAAAGGPSAGDRLPFISRWSVGASIIKEVGLGDRGMLTPRLDYSYKSKVFFSPSNNPIHVQGGYSLLNGSVSWRSVDDKYALTFRVDNIGDKDYIFYRDQSPSSGTTGVFPARDRQWYLSGEYRF